MRKPADIKVELSMSPLAAGHLKVYLEQIIPHRATPAHVRHTLFALHAKVVAAIEAEEGK